jgi:membrane-associated protein
MEVITQLIDYVMHIDKYLAKIIEMYDTWTYLILFAIIFCETGLVVTPFLPGDSLVFVIGTLAATGSINMYLILMVLIIAAIAGNTVNYFIGRFIGKKIIESENIPLIKRVVKKEYIEKAQGFYEKHGGKAVLLSRFLPILRTFAPFVAGIGKMSIKKFSIYNSIGGISWVSCFMLAGYFFGNFPAVKNNFTYVVFGIIFITILPAVYTWISTKRSKSKAVV